MSKECRELLSSLPKDIGWIESYLYEYEGFWYPARHLQGVVNCQKHFQAQDTDILLVTTPKSGTTWLKAILFSLVNRKCYPISSKENPLLTNNPQILVPFLDIVVYFDGQNPDLSSFTSPRLFATHSPIVSLPNSIKDSACKIVYLCRDPKDTFVSMWHFAKKLRPPTNTTSLEVMFDKFCKGASPYGPFWDHVLGYWEGSLENPEKVFFMTYEDMKEEPVVHLRKLAAFLGCPFSVEEETEGLVDILRMCSFENLSNLEVNKEGRLPAGVESKVFFRKGEVGDWKNHLTVEMVERMEQISGEKFRGSGLRL